MLSFIQTFFNHIPSHFQLFTGALACLFQLFSEGPSIFKFPSVRQIKGSKAVYCLACLISLIEQVRNFFLNVQLKCCIVIVDLLVLILHCVLHVMILYASRLGISAFVRVLLSGDGVETCNLSFLFLRGIIGGTSLPRCSLRIDFCVSFFCMHLSSKIVFFECIRSYKDFLKFYFDAG